MVLKRHLGEEGSGDSPIPNYPQSKPTKFQKAVKYVMKEVYLQDIAAIFEPIVRRAVKEEVEPLVALLQSSPSRSISHQTAYSSSRGLQLLIVNKLPSTVFTNSKIEDQEHCPLQVHLVDANSKNVIRSGPLSSVKVQIVALRGDFSANEREDWSEDQFDESVVREREGKRPLLVGELSFALVNGVGSLDNISFTDNSSWIRSRKFKLGIRAVSKASLGTGIREAVSEAFVVLDHRGESYQKHNTPSLDDPVWRLKKISKLGASHKKLELHGIKTVKDFLMQYHMNPLHLRHVLGKGVANRVWDTMVRHANKCHLESNFYIFYDEAERTQLMFNCVYKLIEVKFASQDYQPVDSLDSRQKALVEKLKQSAFSNLHRLVPIHSSSAVSSLEVPTIGYNIPFSTPNLDLQHDGFSLIEQGGSDKQLDFNLSDSASYPCTVEDGYLPEDDSTSQTNQPPQVFSPAAFLMSDSSAEPSDSGYNWYLNSPVPTFALNNMFGELSSPQTTLYPRAAAWGQEDGHFTTSTPAAHIDFLSQLPDFGVNISGAGKTKAGWCKIRAAVMWKIVRRNAAAKRKANFNFGYY